MTRSRLGTALFWVLAAGCECAPVVDQPDAGSGLADGAADATGADRRRDAATGDARPDATVADRRSDAAIGDLRRDAAQGDVRIDATTSDGRGDAIGGDAGGHDRALRDAAQGDAALPPGDHNFSFVETPEFVFVRGQPDQEELGPFMIDLNNLWPPGDIDNAAGWRPAVATTLVLTGTLTGVSYDPATARLSYDGSGSGSQTASAHLEAPTLSKTGPAFSIRVLEPTVVWGTGATTRTDIAALYSGVPRFDPADGASSGFNAVQSAQVSTTATYDAPNVWLILGGDYDDAQFDLQGVDYRLRFKTESKFTYVVGEPAARPVMRNGELSLGPGYYLGYFKNFEWINFRSGISHRIVDEPAVCLGAFTKIYQHDGVGQVNGIGSDAYEGSSSFGVVAPVTYVAHIWAFHGRNNGGSGNTTHQFYIEGRPNSALHINNSRFDGANGCSVVKSTRWLVSVRNSWLSGLEQAEPPYTGLRANKILDLTACGRHVITNNRLIGAYDPDSGGGPQSGLIHLRSRRDWWASDLPAYPRVGVFSNGSNRRTDPLRITFTLSAPDDTIQQTTLAIDGGAALATQQDPVYAGYSAPAPDDAWYLDLLPAELPATSGAQVVLTVDYFDTSAATARSREVRFWVFYPAWDAGARFASDTVSGGYHPATNLPGFATSADTFFDPAFWAAVRSRPLSDPANLYTFKHYIAHNQFVWIRDASRTTQEAFRDDGTAPRTALTQFSSYAMFGAVPRAQNGDLTWAERSVGFFVNNSYAGWTVDEMADPESWFNLESDADQASALSDADAALPTPPRTVVPVGGERTPASPAEPRVAVPAWFEL